MKFLDCLPTEIASCLNEVADVRELRVRDGCPVKVNIAGRWYFAGNNGSFTAYAHSAITIGKVCDDIVKKACSNSVYAYEKSLSNGYFTLEDGVRVGVCGHLFGADKRVFRQYTSLCFRVPHYVSCVSAEVLKRCVANNTIVLGAPARGKTTCLRDIAVKLGARYNVLVVDERGELFYDDKLMSLSCCDVLKWSDKAYAFEVGARAMSPEYFICDEINELDVPFVKSCASSGIKLICSAHALNEEDFSRRFGIADLFGFVIDLNERGIKIT